MQWLREILRQLTVYAFLCYNRTVKGGMNVKPTRMIALDLDGTALQTDSTLSGAVEQAIRDAIEVGIEVVIASGRPFGGLPEAVISIEGISYAVVSNGAAVYDIRTGERIWQKALQAQAVHAVLEIAERTGCTPELFIEGKAYAHGEYVADPVRFGRSAQFVSYVQTTRTPVEDVNCFAKTHENDFDSIALICPDFAEKQKLMEQLRNSIPDVYVTTSGGDLIELMHKDTGKAAGLAQLADICRITPEEIAAFGNGDNDADMLRYAGIGIAVENASALCREASCWIVKCNDEDGAAQGIRMLLERNKRLFAAFI